MRRMKVIHRSEKVLSSFELLIQRIVSRKAMYNHKREYKMEEFNVLLEL